MIHYYELKLFVFEINTFTRIADTKAC